MEWADLRCFFVDQFPGKSWYDFQWHAFTHITVHHRYPVKSGNVPPLEHGKLYGNIISPWYCWDMPCCVASFTGCPWCQDLFKEMFGSEDPFADFNKFFQDAPWILKPSATLCKMWSFVFFCLWGWVKERYFFVSNSWFMLSPPNCSHRMLFVVPSTCFDLMIKLNPQISPIYPSHIHWPRARNMQIYTDIQHMPGTAHIIYSSLCWCWTLLCLHLSSFKRPSCPSCLFYVVGCGIIP